MTLSPCQRAITTSRRFWWQQFWPSRFSFCKYRRSVINNLLSSLTSDFRFTPDWLSCTFEALCAPRHPRAMNPGLYQSRSKTTVTAAVISRCTRRPLWRSLTKTMNRKCMKSPLMPHSASLVAGQMDHRSNRRPPHAVWRHQHWITPFNSRRLGIRRATIWMPPRIRCFRIRASVMSKVNPAGTSRGITTRTTMIPPWANQWRWWLAARGTRTPGRAIARRRVWSIGI